jgi:hypothetical protein
MQKKLEMQIASQQQMTDTTNSMNQDSLNAMERILRLTLN